MSLTPDKRGRQTTFLVIAGLAGTIALWVGACAPGPAVTGAQGKPSAPLASQTSLIARRYEQGPYAMGTSTQGDQSGLDMRDRYRLGIQGRDDYARQLYQKGFAQLDADQQDRVLADLDPTYDDAFGNPLLRITSTSRTTSARWCARSPRKHSHRSSAR